MGRAMTQNAPARFDLCAVGNAIVDVLAPCEPVFLETQGLTPGSMQLVDEVQSAALYDAMAAGVEASGGSAGNTVAGVVSFGGRAAYLGKVADDVLGEVFAHDIRAAGVHFDTSALIGGAGTGRCLINVTPDGQRTMCTFLGAANQLTVDDIDTGLIGDSAIVYLEGYLFDPAPARAAFDLRTLREDVGNDACRFFYVLRKSDQHNTCCYCFCIFKDSIIVEINPSI